MIPNNTNAMPTLNLNSINAAPGLTTDPACGGYDQPNEPTAEDKLTPGEKAWIKDLSHKIDLSNSRLISQYGVSAQMKVAEFSDTALRNVRAKDFGEVGSLLNHLVGELKDIDHDDKKGFMGLFHRGQTKLTRLRLRYQTTDDNINHITQALQQHQRQLFDDVQTLEQLYLANQSYYKEIVLFIQAGKTKLADTKPEMDRLISRSEASGLQEDAQAVNDLTEQCSRFEKKLHDLDLTRMISIQMVPQIRMVQHNDLLMAEKIQSSIVNTIPLWKGQMVMALGMNHSREAAKAQKSVTDLTNALLRKNADTLKFESIAIAKESERGIVDMDTLQYTNSSLIDTFTEVLKIQAEGSHKRKQAESELIRLEKELSDRLANVYQRRVQKPGQSTPSKIVDA